VLQKCIILSLLIFSCLLAFPANKNPLKDSTTVVIQLDNAMDQNTLVDSVYLIFDRYDRSGAGIVRQIFYPVNNTIKVVVPKGKYYVNIVCIGTYNREYFDKIIKAKSDKENKIFVKLEASALFTPGFVSIPEEKIDFANLSITRYTFYK
jgi:hypothetical protein